MWVDKYKGYLNLVCKECGSKLEGRLDELGTVGSNDTAINILPCANCTAIHEDKIGNMEDHLDNIVDEYEAQIKALKGRLTS